MEYLGGVDRRETVHINISQPESMTYPHDKIGTSDYFGNGAQRRVLPASTYIDEDTLKRLISVAKPDQIFFGLRGSPNPEPWITWILRSGTDAFIADASSMNIERPAREAEVRSVCKAALEAGSKVVVATQLIAHTHEMRPTDALKILETQPAVPVTSDDVLIAQLKRVLGRA